MIELKSKIAPSVVQLGAVKEGEVLQFSITNESPYPFEGFSACGCITVALHDWILHCTTPAEFNGQVDNLYKVNDVYYTGVPIGQTVRYYPLHSANFVETLPEGEVTRHKASKFDKTIIAYLRDGETVKMFNKDGKLVDNPKKHQIGIPVIFWVLQND